MIASDEKRQRWFVVPDEVELPSGDYVLRAFKGGHHKVLYVAVAPFEVSKEEAAARIDEQLGAAWGRLRGGFQKLVDLGVDVAADRGVEVDPEQAKNPLPESIGLSLGEVVTDPEAARDKVGGFFEQLASGLRETASALPREPVEVPPPPVPDEVKRKLKAMVEDPALANALRTVGSRLQELAADLPSGAPSEE